MLVAITLCVFIAFFSGFGGYLVLQYTGLAQMAMNRCKTEDAKDMLAIGLLFALFCVGLTAAFVAYPYLSRWLSPSVS